MKTLALWHSQYAHDRRLHRHRCRVCNRIINAGEPVWMAKTAWKRTKAIHQACADTWANRPGTMTSVELLGMHAATYRDPSLNDAQALAISRIAIAAELATVE